MITLCCNFYLTGQNYLLYWDTATSVFVCFMGILALFYVFMKTHRFSQMLQGFFIILSWMPIYFNFVRTNTHLLFEACISGIHQYLEIQVKSFVLQVYHVDLRHAAWFSAVPWSVMAIMGYLAGLWSDLLIRSGTSITLTRKIMQVTSSCA